MAIQMTIFWVVIWSYVRETIFSGHAKLAEHLKAVSS